MSPPDRSNAIPHELLLGQAGFLRRLARDLVGDPHAAEDAVQEVMLTALERPPRHDANIHGWLAAVLKNLVSKRSRAHVRRTHHEQEAARTSARGKETLPAESESTVRSVTEAVLALEEPYRSTVLMRYFEELTPSAIAKRQSVSVATVKSRLQRALEILRVRMKRTKGNGWQASLLALTVPSKIGKGVILMSLKTKLVVALAVVLLGWVLLHDWSSFSVPRPLEGSSASSATLDATKSSPATALTGTEAGAPGREALAASARVADETLGQDTLVFGSMFGDSQSGSEKLKPDWVIFTDASGRRTEASVESDATYSVSKLALGKYWISARNWGWRTLEEPFELEAEHPRVRHDLHLRAAPVLSVFVRAPDGSNLEPVVMEHLSRPNPGLGPTTIPKLIPVATREHPGAWIPEVIGSANNIFGVGVFLQYSKVAEQRKEGSIGVLVVDEELPVYASLVEGHAVLATERVEPGADEVVFVIAPDAREMNFATLKMRVLDAETRVPLAHASCRLTGGPNERGGQSDSNGVMLVRACEPGQLHMSLQAEGHEMLTCPVELRPRKTTDLGEILLAKGLDAEFRVFATDGSPCKAYFELGALDPTTLAVDFERDSRSWDSDENGILKVPSLGRRVYVLRTADTEAGFDTIPAGRKSVSGNLVIDMRAGILPVNRDIHLKRASLLLLNYKGPYSGGPRFRVLDGQGIELVASRLYGSAPLGLTLPPDNYRVEVLDQDGSVLVTKSVTLGIETVSVELSR